MARLVIGAGPASGLFDTLSSKQTVGDLGDDQGDDHGPLSNLRNQLAWARSRDLAGDEPAAP